MREVTTPDTLLDLVIEKFFRIVFTKTVPYCLVNNCEN